MGWRRLPGVEVAVGVEEEQVRVDPAPRQPGESPDHTDAVAAPHEGEIRLGHPPGHVSVEGRHPVQGPRVVDRRVDQFGRLRREEGADPVTHEPRDMKGLHNARVPM